MKYILLLRAKLRILFGFCPKCNSDAPEMDTCYVCCGYRWNCLGYPSKGVKKYWYKKYKKVL